jgi:hypothetical protein
MIPWTGTIIRTFVVALLPAVAAAQGAAPAPAPAQQEPSSPAQAPPRPEIAVAVPAGVPPMAAELLRRLEESRGQNRAVGEPRIVGPGPVFAASSELTPYTSGLNALQQRDYERAIGQFERVIASAHVRADGALYWKAFAEHRLGQTTEAVATLATLRQEHPQSRYLPDAKVLDAEIRRISGQPLSLDELSAHDDIKLLALNGLARTDPVRAVPLISDVLAAANSLAVKRRAIMVLAGIDDERAHQALMRHATGGNPDLQSDAVRYLATRRDGRTTTADFRRIYEATQDRVVRRTVIDALRAAGEAEALVAIARQERDLDMRREIVGRLAEMAPRSPAAADYLAELLHR